jgi:hypothetical protein
MDVFKSLDKRLKIFDDIDDAERHFNLWAGDAEAKLLMELKGMDYTSLVATAAIVLHELLNRKLDYSEGYYE